MDDKGIRERLAVADVAWGVVFEDPYRDLEDESPEVREWQAELDAQARAAIAAIPDLDGLTAAVARHANAAAVSAPKRGGHRWFHVDGEGRLRVADALDVPGRTVVDRPSDDRPAPGPDPAGPLAGGAHIDWHVPAPSGDFVAIGTSCAGDEQSTLHIVDTASGRPTGPVVPFMSGGRVAWLPDGSGLYCCAGEARDTESALKGVLHVEVGGAARPLPLPSPVSERRLLVQVSPDGRYLGVVGNPFAPRLLYVHDRHDETWLEALSDGPDDIVFCGVFVGERYYAVTTRGAPCGRLVAAPLHALGDEEAWAEIVGPSEGVMRAVAAAGSELALCDYVNGRSRVRVVTTEGEILATVPLPDEGVVSATGLNAMQSGADPPLEATRDEAVFTFSTPSRAPALCRYDWTLARLEAIAPPREELSALQVESRSCASADGHPVRYDVVRQGEPADGVGGPNPTLVVAYGGWNMVSPGGYLGPLAPIVEAGGILVYAHVRGDATHGSDRWHAGRRAAKQRSFDDLYAVVEDLIAQGVTTPDRLGVHGSSNGGLLVGAAITQRPELFRAAVALVPLLDMGRFVRERFAELFTWEYGDPRRPGEAAWLRGYSPYHNVVDGVTYPATMIVCAGRDVRCHPWHGRKMAAALRAANTGPRPIHLRVHPDRGHQSATVGAPPWLTAEWLGFAMSQLGLPLPKLAEAAVA